MGAVRASKTMSLGRTSVKYQVGRSFDVRCFWVKPRDFDTFGAHNSFSGTALQAGRSRVRFPMVSLDFFIDIILPAVVCPWGWLSL